MSKKTENLADVALEDKDDVDNTVPTVRVTCSDVVYSVGRGRLASVVPVTKTVKFPPNVTDQLHGLSIAEMIKRGQGDVKEPQLTDFDLPDGKDDGTLEPVGLRDFDWADPAERFEKEVALRRAASAISRSFPKKASSEGSKAAAPSAKEGSNEVASSAPGTPASE